MASQQAQRNDTPAQNGLVSLPSTSTPQTEADVRPRKRKAVDEHNATISKKRNGALSNGSAIEPGLNHVEPGVLDPNTEKLVEGAPAAAAGATDVQSQSDPNGNIITPKAVINQAPSRPLDVFVFGGNSGAELGLGETANSASVKRPRLNPNLLSTGQRVVSIAVGGMHCIALTESGAVLSWGVNDLGALGRPTDWDGGLKDMGDEDDESTSDDEGEKLNPLESTPGVVSFPDNVTVTGLAASDNASFVLTDDGRVYGWGTFRDNEGKANFSASTEIQRTPTLMDRVHGITQITAGEDHILALSTTGRIWVWGASESSQLGRSVQEKMKLKLRRPWELRMINDIVHIGTGSKNSFAIDKQGRAYGWGQNNFGQCGIFDGVGEFGARVERPAYISALRPFEPIKMITGGNSHSIALSADGRVITWGRLDGYATGHDIATLADEEVIKNERGQPRILKVPKALPDLQDAVWIASGSEHTLAVTATGHCFSWGFSTDYRTGLGTEDDAKQPQRILNSKVENRIICWAGAGGQFSVIASEVIDAA